MPHFYYSLGTFGVLEFLGDIWPGLIANHLCFPILGCNLGFFGYDGLIHFISGVCVGLGLLWAQGRFGGIFLAWGRTAWAFAAWGAAVALAWEIMEWSYDLARIYLLNMDLLSPNRLTQPNSLDTIGDIVLGLLGTMLIYLAYRRHPAHA